MRILVISDTPWSDDNSFGNTMDSIFYGMTDIEFANVYCRPGKPNSDMNICYYQITERTLINNIIDRTKPSGQRVFCENETEIDMTRIKGYSFSRKSRLQVLYWARDIIWRIGRWQSENLDSFIRDFNPDIMFQIIYYSSYINKMAIHYHMVTRVPMIGYITDDNYSLRQFKLSPLYWIDRLYKRTIIRKCIECCSILYVISNIQKREYERCFSLPCKVLTKCADFSIKKSNTLTHYSNNIVLNYAGGIADGRYNSLSLISRAVENLINDGYSLQFDIYTNTALTGKVKRALNHRGTFIHGAIPYDDIRKVQEKADILIHVEGLDVSSRLVAHQSFSTKLVDYFEMGKCIFAVGTDDVASIAHLRENDAALIASDYIQVYDTLHSVIKDTSIMQAYGKKAFECGKKWHSRNKMQKMLQKDITGLIARG